MKQFSRIFPVQCIICTLKLNLTLLKGGDIFMEHNYSDPADKQ